MCGDCEGTDSSFLTRGFESQKERLGTHPAFLRAPERGKNPPIAAPGAVPHFLHLRTPVPRMQSSGQSPGSSSIPLPRKIAPGQGKGAGGFRGRELEGNGTRKWPES